MFGVTAMRALSAIAEANWGQGKKNTFVFPRGYSVAFTNLVIAIWMNSRQNRSSVESVDRLLAH